MLNISRVMSFYAVRRGRVPGIYRTWDECNAQVNRQPGASFKKFKTLAEANDFITSADLKTSLFASSKTKQKRIKRSRSDLTVDEVSQGIPGKRKKLLGDGEGVGVGDEGRKEEDWVVVYTDGSCQGNGKQSARAGVGVYWGPANPLNISERLAGRQTNQRAEIVACCRALEVAKEQKISNLEIRTDSKFVINAMTDWIQRWKKDGWKKVTGNHVTNKDDFRQLDKLANGIHIKWTHVSGHCGVFGNEEADKLARSGASRPQSD